jgi:SET domain
MADKCFATVSDVPSSYLAHCDACHGSLLEPYMHPIDVINPACCDKVAYCTTACYETALNGYHRVVCGKDIEWLYQDFEGTYGKKAARDHSRSLLFLRVMCTVLSDRRYQREMGETPTHPLLHPLITRMTGYNPPPGELHPGPGSDWMYSENVVIPHRILQLLKVDIFKSSEFTPEVIQTIYWRLDNNACGGIVNLSGKDHQCRSSSTGSMRRRGGEHEEETLSLNPNYLFFNHSCEPNVNWRGSTPNQRVGTSWLKGLSGEILRPGCSAVWCIADKDVKKGEELKISYVGTPLGHDRRDRMNKRFMLTKWFHGGCGCNVCVHEDETGVMDEDCSDEESNEDNEVGGEGSEERSRGLASMQPA